MRVARRFLRRDRLIALDQRGMVDRDQLSRKEGWLAPRAFASILAPLQGVVRSTGFRVGEAGRQSESLCLIVIRTESTRTQINERFRRRSAGTPVWAAPARAKAEVAKEVT